jgi:hypothetical protein
MSASATLQSDLDDPTNWIGPPPLEPSKTDGKDHADSELINALSVETWCDLSLPPPRRLLGDVVTEAARVFLVGATGIGKTLFAYAIAAALAAGKPFLHWACDGPSRVLVIDGEMSARIVKKRAQLVLRHQADVMPGNLLIYSLQRSDEFAARFPTLGTPAPLNTDNGREWLLRLIALVQPDLVILDNVMSLIAGVMKEEEPWQQTLPLVLGITALSKAQIWLDHTGHNSDRQYGTSTKGWLFDAIGVMRRPDGEQTRDRETCFDLSFEPPTGKARNRDPDRWNDFASHRIRLGDEGWSAEPTGGSTRGKAKGTVAPSVHLFHNALIDAIAVARTAPGETTRAAWEAECVRRDLLDPITRDDDGKTKGAKRAMLRKAKSALLYAKMISINGEQVRDLTHQY